MAPIIQRHHPMASFDGSHHMMASIIHPSLDGIIRWFPSFDVIYKQWSSRGDGGDLYRYCRCTATCKPSSDKSHQVLRAIR
eukprot:scaffold21775_cov39-Cyclotella_meneghiniana.AAC.3